MNLIVFIKYAVKLFINTLLKSEKYILGFNKPFVNKALFEAKRWML